MPTGRNCSRILFGYAMRWSGEDEATSVLYGSCSVSDTSCTSRWRTASIKTTASSPGDAISDVAGATVPLLQETFPALKSFALKWSYFPSKEYIDAFEAESVAGVHRRLRGTDLLVFLDAASNVRQSFVFLDPGMAQGCPSALAHIDSTMLVAPPRFVVTFDISLSASTGSDFFDGVLTALDHIHVPTPGFIVERGTVTFGIIY